MKGGGRGAKNALLYSMSLLVEKKKKIPSDLRQNLLELVAYYNESEAIEDGDETRQV